MSSGGHGAWILIGASTAACVCGSLVIYFDVVWNKLTRGKWGKDLVFQDNNQVLVVSMSLSSGVLLLTSMYSLLPEALQYFKQSPQLEGSPKLSTAILFSTYLAGVVLCAIFNLIIHACTSKSIVHCAHDEESGSSGHRRHHDDGEESGHSENHGHGDESHHDANPQHSQASGSQNQRRHGSTDSDENAETVIDETTTLLPIDSKTIAIATNNDDNGHGKLNILDLSYGPIKSREFVGKCMGYSDASKCVHQKVIEPFRADDGKIGLHVCDEFCRLGAEDSDGENVTYSCRHKKSHHNNTYDSCSDIQSPRGTPIQSSSSSRQGPSDGDDDDDDHENHHHRHHHHHHHRHHHHSDPNSAESHQGDAHSSDHHHHVVSPYSRVLSIGLQTALAITIHKIPEGFVTFATFKENPQLGISVFTALAVHNFAEGFSIAFPLFLSLRKRFAAFAIAALLGGLSQPLGALLAHISFGEQFSRGEALPAFTFGVLVSFTAGFMSIIGLQMYGTAVAFGGKQYVTLPFAFLGVAIVGLSSVLTE